MAWDHEGSRHARGYGWQWVKLRERILVRDLYLCQPCLDAGRTTQATEVHHIKAKSHGGDDDEGNLISICSPCHDKESRKQFGWKPRVVTGKDGWPVGG